RRILELIATGTALKPILGAICELIDETSDTTSAIYLLDQDGRQLRFAAGPHIPEVWQRVTHTFPATPTTGACGAAVDRREPVIVTDVQTSPLFASPEWRAAARASDIVAAWSTPFFGSDRRALGTFALFGKQASPPSAEQKRRVHRAAYVASIAVEHQQ